MTASSLSSPATGGGAPKISVLVPTYNYARYLPQAIESLLAQDYTDYEILLSDDASGDDSAEIIRHYATRSPRIRFQLHTTNQGMVANWNWCLRQARGDYVKFCFGDDLLTTTDALSRYAALLDEHPNAVLAGSARLLLNSQSQVTGAWDDFVAGASAGTWTIAQCLRQRRNLLGEPTAVIFRRAAASRGFDPGFRQVVDWEMWCHLLLTGDFVYTPKPLCGFRRHAMQQTAVNRQTREGDWETITLLERYLAQPALHPHLRPDSLAHRQILYRQIYYTHKAASIVLARRMPWHWRAVCWCLHRIARPCENLQRKCGRWRSAWSQKRGRPQSTQIPLAGASRRAPALAS